MMLAILLLAESSAGDLTAPIVNGVTGVSVIGALVWGIGKMTAVFEVMQENDQKRTDATINSVNAIASRISEREEARTNAALQKIDAQATFLAELAKGQAAASTQIITTLDAVRNHSHELRSLVTDVTAQRMYDQKGRTDGKAE